MHVYAVVYRDPSSIDSLWTTKEGAQQRCDELNSGYADQDGYGVPWTVARRLIHEQWQPTPTGPLWYADEQAGR